MNRYYEFKKIFLAHEEYTGTSYLPTKLISASIRKKNVKDTERIFPGVHKNACCGSRMSTAGTKNIHAFQSYRQRGHIRYILWTFFVPAVSATGSGVLVLYQADEPGNGGIIPHYRSLLDN